MGFFCILRDPAAKTDCFIVEDCHVNLWALKGILGRRDFVWDVGLRIRAGSEPFKKFRIALPSGISSDKMSDLFEKVRDQKIGQMIFGKPISIKNGNIIDYGQGDLRLSRVPAATAKRDDVRSTEAFTIWNLEIANGIQPGEQTYLRVRFPVQTLGRVWTWKGFFLSRYGALVDVRFLDLREAWNVPDSDALKDEILPIKKLYFFVVAPSAFYLLASSPNPHYTRVLEGRAWESYLNRKVSILTKEKLTIYQWRNEQDISSSAPFRVYLDLRNHLGILSKYNLLGLAAVLALLCSLGVIAAPFLPQEVSQTVLFSKTLIEKHFVGLTATGAVILVVKWIPQLKKLREFFRGAVRCIEWIESKIYAIK